jgi:tryptophan synthase alpha subunit
MIKVLLAGFLGVLLGVMAILAPLADGQTIGPTYGAALKKGCPSDKTVVMVIRLRDREYIKDAYTEIGGIVPLNKELHAFWFETSELPGVAQIYLPPPRGQEDEETMRTWGHEMMHAVCGDWHED